MHRDNCFKNKLRLNKRKVTEALSLNRFHGLLFIDDLKDVYMLFLTPMKSRKQISSVIVDHKFVHKYEINKKKHVGYSYSNNSIEFSLTGIQFLSHKLTNI